MKSHKKNIKRKASSPGRTQSIYMKYRVSMINSKTANESRPKQLRSFPMLHHSANGYKETLR